LDDIDIGQEIRNYINEKTAFYFVQTDSRYPDPTQQFLTIKPTIADGFNLGRAQATGSGTNTG